jgi:division protein CdvB (Snf7/Vps24/ESCRT-III family)
VDLSKFTSRWHKNNDSDGGVTSRIRGGLRSNEPLRPKLEQASKQIQTQIIRLDQTSTKLREKDRSLFSGIVSCIQKNDNQRANMLASELIQIRKMKNMVTQTRLALEQITLRLSTITELGDLATILGPAVNTIKSVRPGLSNLVPDAEQEISEISSVLSGIMIEAGQVSTGSLSFEPTSEEADNVLAQAAAIVEQQEKAKFPDVPETERRELESA